jgi:hypothetical protein
MTDPRRIVKPVAPPHVFENAYTPDQHARMLQYVRDHGPWSLILSQHFKTPEEVIATNAGVLPEGVKATWDMFLSPVFRGYFAQGFTSLHSDLDDCFYNKKFIDHVRAYWKAEYVRPENMLFNLQGPSNAGDAPHVDGNRFRGLGMQTCPVWLMNVMGKSGLFEQWKSRKAQVIAWYYQGNVGGGFTYWPDGQFAEPKKIEGPMWSRAVVVENERMYHMAESCGPEDQRRPAGLDIGSLIRPVAGSAADWEIVTGEKVIQHIPEQQFRFLIHWGADVFKDYSELKVALDHSDDLNTNIVFDIFVSDLKAQGVAFTMPSDPLHDIEFMQLLNKVYDTGSPSIFPPPPVVRAA